MKNFLKSTLLLLFAATAFTGCEKDKSYEDPGLEVSLYNISGTWKLASWNNGAELAEGSYVYLELAYRDGNTFTIYQNLDSFGPRRITGSYNLYTDESLGSVIRGMYDYENGDWTSRYIIRDLYADRMTWIATDDAGNVSIYERCDGIPQEILDRLSLLNRRIQSNESSPEERREFLALQSDRKIAPSSAILPELGLGEPVGLVSYPDELPVYLVDAMIL